MKLALSIILYFLLVFPAFADRTEDLKEFKSHYKSFQHWAVEKKYLNAYPHIATCLELSKKLWPEKNKNSLMVALDYAFILNKKGEYKRARKLLKEKIKLVREIFGEESTQMVDFYLFLAESKKSKLSFSMDLKKAKKIAEKSYGKDSLAYAEFLQQSGDIYYMNRRETMGRRAYSESIDIKKKLDVKEVYIAAMQFRQGKLEHQIRQDKKAETLVKEAVKGFEGLTGYSNNAEISARALLIEILERQNKTEEATEQCIAIGKMVPFDKNQEYKPIFKIAPNYPSAAKKKRLEGYVTVQYDVNELGLTINHKVIDNNGNDMFDEVSLNAAKRFRYIPRFVNGKAQTVRSIQNRFTFKLMMIST